MYYCLGNALCLHEMTVYSHNASSTHRRSIYVIRSLSLMASNPLALAAHPAWGGISHWHRVYITNMSNKHIVKNKRWYKYVWDHEIYLSKIWFILIALKFQSSCNMLNQFAITVEQYQVPTLTLNFAHSHSICFLLSGRNLSGMWLLLHFVKLHKTDSIFPSHLVHQFTDSTYEWFICKQCLWFIIHNPQCSLSPYVRRVRLQIQDRIPNSTTLKTQLKLLNIKVELKWL